MTSYGTMALMTPESATRIPVDRAGALATRAALAPSSLILSGFRNPNLSVEHKSDGSPVTEFDRRAERSIREVLGSEDPAWPVLGEEYGGDTTGSPFRWVVDPIDGTMPFSRGLPYFGTLVALEETAVGRALAGAIQLPAFGELYTAGSGLGARCNGEPIRVAPRRELSDCLLSAPEVQKFRKAGLDEGYERLGSVVRYFRGNGDCWMHAMAARGAVDAVIEFSLNRWDIAATEIIVAEAGGLVVKRASRSVPGKVDTVFGNPYAVERIIELLDFRPE
jgi:histidinol-phosphatase